MDDPFAGVLDILGALALGRDLDGRLGRGTGGTAREMVGRIALSVQRHVGFSIDPDLHAVFTQRRVGRTGDPPPGDHHQSQRRLGGQVHLVGHHLDETGDPGLGQAVEVGPHGIEIEDGAFPADLDDQLVGRVIHKGARVSNPSGQGTVRRRGIARELDAGLPDVLEPDDDLGAVAVEVVADLVRDQALLQTPQMEIPTVAEELRPMFRVPGNGSGTPGGGGAAARRPLRIDWAHWGGTIEGGRRRLLRSSPGKTSVGVAKKTAKPREKKLGESPGLEKISRGIWKCRSPIWMKISDSKSCEISRGTVGSESASYRESTGKGRYSCRIGHPQTT